LYASLSAAPVVWLSLRVVKLRRAKRIRLGDGGDPDLRNAIRAHGNATEYIPLLLVLLALLELNGAHWALIHTAGLVLLSGRLLHARGLLQANLRNRILGMQLTVYALIGLAATNFGYAAFGLIAG